MAGFKRPGDPNKPPEYDKLGNYKNHLVLIRPKQYGPQPTRDYGVATVLFSDVIIPEPENGSGSYLNLGDNVPIFWKKVQRQLDESIGEWTGGILRQGSKDNAQEWWIDDASEADIEVLEAVLKSIEDY